MGGAHMIPTAHLRQVPITHFEPDYDDYGCHRNRVKEVVSGYTLQQWWAHPLDDLKLFQVANPYDGICEGVWKDVEVVK